MTFFVVELVQAGKNGAHEPHWSPKKYFQAVNKHDQAMIIQIGKSKISIISPWKGCGLSFEQNWILSFYKEQKFSLSSTFSS